MAQTTTSIHTTPGAPTQRYRLIRAGVAPVVGSFRQDGHAVQGQLTLTGACNSESFQRQERQEVTETRTNTGNSMALTVASAIVSAVGVGLLVAAGGADDRVTCGEMQSGDKCLSESGAYTEAGVGVLGLGLSGVIAGGYFLMRKPEVETKQLPAQEASRVTAKNVACGNTANLEGMVAALELPGNGTWTGRVAADGSVRIAVNENVPLPEQGSARVIVQTVSAGYAGVIAIGATLGEVSFVRPSPSPATGLSRKLSRR